MLERLVGKAGAGIGDREFEPGVLDRVAVR